MNGPEQSSRLFFAVGSVFGFTGVATGAFGAHTLKTQLTVEMLDIFETAVRYQLYHVFALLAAGLAARRAGFAATPIRIAGWCFIIGTVLFCGSLYVLALTGARWLGAVTPIGGFAFLVGWLALIRAVWKKGE